MTKVLQLFRSGNDTLQIAAALKMSEAEVYNLLWRERADDLSKSSSRWSLGRDLVPYAGKEMS